MSYILLIETSSNLCSVGLCKENQLISLREDRKPNSHASLVAVFIDEMLRENGLAYNMLDAVAVSKGPGSYTGLRIGVSSAKGICYAASKPMIALGTLDCMAECMISNAPSAPPDALFIPMLDARRMEVYMAVYNSKGEQIKPVCAELIAPATLTSLKPAPVFIGGDGAYKVKDILLAGSYVEFLNAEPSARYMCGKANQALLAGDFVDTAYFEPFYLKDFIAGKPKVKGLH